MTISRKRHEGCVAFQSYYAAYVFQLSNIIIVIFSDLLMKYDRKYGVSNRVVQKFEGSEDKKVKCPTDILGRKIKSRILWAFDHASIFCKSRSVP